ncbi:hypothetical protein [Phenylobacterium sp.]|jgi:hypothetical protein|uniref:hypothetical protein n=1 Tax=Phenylobacterium sp. TaxID=1871053 RepID=UPI002F3FBD4A
MLTFKVWLATDTLLYLPIYALADLGILARVAPTAGLGTEVAIEIRTAPGEGDRAAISHMLKQSEAASESEIHIAVCDPLAAWHVDKSGKSAVLMGAFIKRPTFWVLGRDVSAGHENIDHKWVYYEEKFVTGNYLGKILAAELDEPFRQRCSMGDEFKYFQEAEAVPGTLRVLTADIHGMVLCQQADPSVHVKDKLMDDPRFSHFLTTGILTHRRHYKQQAKAMSVFMEAVRSSCVLLRTAEQPAAALIRQLLERGSETKPALDDDVTAKISKETIANRVAARLFDDRVYSESLDVEFQDWANAVHAGSWKDKKAAQKLFYKIYEPREANRLTGEWLIKSFKDYGRFVREARALRGGVAAALAALATSQIALSMMEREVPAHKGPLGATTWVYLLSVMLAAGALCWVTVSITMVKSRFLLPLQRFLSADEDATRGLVTSVAMGFLAVVTLWAGEKFFKLRIMEDHVILWAIPILTGAADYVYKLIRKSRNA